ncbi:MAG: 6-bladed beta-propeller [Gemmatimonadota bacterium]
MREARSWTLSLTAVALIGCGPPTDRPLTERTDSAGIELVTSNVDDRPLPWRLERRIALGGAEEGPESFFRLPPGTVASDARGQIYVLDPLRHRVVVFTPDGTFVRSVGGEGAGPGELESPGALSVGPDGVLSVFDFGKGALVRFGPDGTVLPQHPLPFFPWTGPSRHFEVTSEGVLVSTMLPPAPEGMFHQALRLLGPADTVLVAERIFPRPGMVRYPTCGGGLNYPPIFEAQVLWAAHDRRIVAVDGPEYAFTLFEGARPIRKVRAGFPLRASSEALALAELGEGMTINFGRGPCRIPPREMVEGRGFAEAVPWIEAVMISPTDDIWIHRKGVGQEIPAAVDVFDRTGLYLGRLPEGSPFPLVFVDDTTFGAAETDEMDVTRLVLYRIAR